MNVSLVSKQGKSVYGFGIRVTVGHFLALCLWVAFNCFDFVGC